MQWLASHAAFVPVLLHSIHSKILFKVCREWKEIASVTRKRVFKEEQQGEIDLFELQVQLNFAMCIHVTVDVIVKCIRHLKLYIL